MDVSAVVFDFDGLVLETEAPVYLAWKEVWAEHGHELVLEDWARCIGTSYSDDTFHPVRELAARCGRAFDEAELDARVSARTASLLADVGLSPGVSEWLAEADRAGLGVAIASSSARSWIVEHLERLGALDRFPVIASYDDVGVRKPLPDAYVHACAQLGVTTAAALAVEDSTHGIAAAKAAGLWCVAVPTAMTAHMEFSQADLVVESLASTSLATVIELRSGTR